MDPLSYEKLFSKFEISNIYFGPIFYYNILPGHSKIRLILGFGLEFIDSEIDWDDIKDLGNPEWRSTLSGSGIGFRNCFTFEYKILPFLGVNAGLFFHLAKIKEYTGNLEKLTYGTVVETYDDALLIQGYGNYGPYPESALDNLGEWQKGTVTLSGLAFTFGVSFHFK